MWVEVHRWYQSRPENKDEILLVNLDRADRIEMLTSAASSTSGTRITWPDGISVLCHESYAEIRQMVYPKSTERAAPVYVDTSR